MRMKKRRSIGSLVTCMLAVSVFLACCCTGALAVTENEASLVSEETGNTIEIPYAFGTLGGGLITGVSDTMLEPQESATRAQVATILQRFTEQVG